MLLSFLRGIVLGFVGGIPVGPVNAAVIDTALRKCFRRAFATGLGGAFADFIYCLACTLGLGTLFKSVPSLEPIFLGVGGVVLLVFGVKTVRTPRLEAEAYTRAPTKIQKRELAGAFLQGLFLTVMNPAAMVSWVLLASTVLAGAKDWEALYASTGVFFGTSIWFLFIAWLASKGRVKLGTNAVWVTRAVGGLLMAYGVFLMFKVSMNVWAHR
jgi:threonine/homoserine/homoserine lactone efflux protein